MTLEEKYKHLTAIDYEFVEKNFINGKFILIAVNNKGIAHFVYTDDDQDTLIKLLDGSNFWLASLKNFKDKMHMLELQNQLSKYPSVSKGQIEIINKMEAFLGENSNK